MIKKYLPTILAFILPALVAAQQPSPTQELKNIIDRLIGWAAALLITLAVAFIVYAAYLYLTSAGDPEKVKQANKVVLYSAVSVGVALLAYVFVAIVRALVGR